MDKQEAMEKYVTTANKLKWQVVEELSDKWTKKTPDGCNIYRPKKKE